MAMLRFRGDAQAVAQVTTATPDHVETGDQFFLAINGKMVRYAAAAATVADVVAGLVAAVNESKLPEFAEIEATDTTTEVTLTAKTPGVPFVVTGSTINGGSADTQTLTITTLMDATGPHHWNAAANWSTNSVPTTGDEVFIEDSDVSILYGLDQSSIILDHLHIAASFTGEIGLPRWCGNGAADYVEYRDRYLAISAMTVEVGSGEGDGSSRIQLNLGTVAANVTVYRTAMPTDADMPAVLLRGTHASNVLNVLGGSVGVAMLGDEVATLATLRHSGGEVRVSQRVTLATVERSGDGLLTMECAATTLHQSGGETRIVGKGAFGTIELEGGEIDYRSNGTITSMTLGHPTATINFSADLRARTVTNCTLQRGVILDPHETVTWTHGIQPETNLVAT